MKKRFIYYAVANLITISRIIITIILLVSLIKGNCSLMFFITINVLIFASDIFDGKVSRYLNAQSTLGEILDVGADFFYLSAVSIVMIMKNVLSVWFLPIVLIEFTVFIITSNYLKDNKRYLIFDNLGRFLAVLYYVTPSLFYITFKVSAFMHDLLLQYGLFMLGILTCMVIIYRVRLCFPDYAFARKIKRIRRIEKREI